MLTPLPITWSLVMHTGQEMEVLKWDLLRLNAQFLLQFPSRRPLCSQYCTLKIHASLACTSRGWEQQVLVHIMEMRPSYRQAVAIIAAFGNQIQNRKMRGGEVLYRCSS